MQQKVHLSLLRSCYIRRLNIKYEEIFQKNYFFLFLENQDDRAKRGVIVIITMVMVTVTVMLMVTVMWMVMVIDGDSNCDGDGIANGECNVIDGESEGNGGGDGVGDVMMVPW